MDLDYSSIFKIFADMCVVAVPIAIFLHILQIVLNLFFSLAFPKFYRRGE